MKLLYSGASPFVRKCLVVAHEVGLASRIESTPATAHPVNRDDAIRAHNPLGQVPTLITDDGQALYDSRVICEYLDAEGRGRLFGSGAARWQALAEQALADGLLGAALLARYEHIARPEELRWPDWVAGQHGKITDALDRFEQILPEADRRATIGTITIGCALGYLDVRFAELDWRSARPATAAWFKAFDERPAMAATRPKT